MKCMFERAKRCFFIMVLFKIRHFYNNCDDIIVHMIIYNLHRKPIAVFLINTKIAQ